GLSLGCVSSERRIAFERKRMALAEVESRLKALTVTPAAAQRAGLPINQDGTRRSAYELLSYPDIDLARLRTLWPEEIDSLPTAIAEQVAIDATYAVYLRRQSDDIAALRRDEALELPNDLDYSTLTGLSNEVRQKLEAVRPATLGQAGRIDGVT